jgi:hypothetical protein
MRYAAALLAASILSGCATDHAGESPLAPSDLAPPPPVSSASAFLWGMVVADSGVCIDGVTVRVVRGQRAGESLTHETPCTVWEYAGGFFLENLTPGVPMTLQASAPGYAVLEKTVIPSAGPQTAVLLTPSKL